MSTTQIAAAPGALPSPSPATAAARRRTVQLPRSPKILIGLGILVFFVILAVIGPWIAPYDPTIAGSALLQGPSAAHLLGTTQSGQDVLSELLVGARPTVFIGFLAGIIATALSILV